MNTEKLRCDVCGVEFEDGSANPDWVVCAIHEEYGRAAHDHTLTNLRPSQFVRCAVCGRLVLGGHTSPWDNNDPNSRVCWDCEIAKAEGRKS